MAGRNNKPDNDGPASSPSSLDQFGDKLAQTTEPKPMAKERKPGTDKC
ncbi:hypothetical protein AB6A23_21770 [Paenibacillus tarimensis]